MELKLKMAIERRKNPRYCVRDNAFAILGPEPVKLVPIIDISLGGLGISVNGSTEPLNGSSRLEILLDDCRFYLDNLPYELLPAFRNLHWNAITSLQSRFYGIKLIDLMPSQKTQLKYFIRNHTMGGMTPKFIRKFNQHFHKFLDKKDYGAACRNISLQRPSL